MCVRGMNGVVGQLYHNYFNILANRGPFVERPRGWAPSDTTQAALAKERFVLVLRVSIRYCRPLLLAGADDYAFQSSANSALAAGRSGIELDSVVGHHLTAIQRGITRAHDLPAQSAFHHTPVLALLTGGKSRRPVASDVGDARHPPLHLNSGGAVPDEIARVETTVSTVLVENRDQFFHSKIAVQRMGRM